MSPVRISALFATVKEPRVVGLVTLRPVTGVPATVSVPVIPVPETDTAELAEVNVNLLLPLLTVAVTP
jgi:hypothetical protein